MSKSATTSIEPGMNAAKMLPLRTRAEFFRLAQGTTALIACLTFQIYAFLASAMLFANDNRSENPLTAPRAEQRDLVHTQHGVPRKDPYAWLRDRDDPATLTYLKAENAYAKAIMAETSALQEKLYEEMRSRIQETDISVAFREGQWWYATATRKGLDHALHYRLPMNPAAPWQIPQAAQMAAPGNLFFDENAHAKGHSYYELGLLEASVCGHWLAFSEDFSGDETYTLRFMNLDTGQILPEAFAETDGDNGHWDLQARSFFFVELDETQRAYRIRRHRIGEDPAQAAIILEEDDDRFILSLQLSQDRRYLFIVSSSKETSSVQFIPMDNPDRPPQTVFDRREGVEYYLEHHHGHFLALINENAPNFRLVRVPVDRPNLAKSEEIVAHQENTRIEDVLPLKNWIILKERQKGIDQLRILHPNSGDTHLLQMPEEVYSLELGPNAEFAQEGLRLLYSSPLSPQRVYDYHLPTRQLSILKERKLPDGFDPQRFRAYRQHFAARDGTPIPVTLVHRKDFQPDARTPLFLEGYGAYGETFKAGFRSSLVNLLERDFVCAIAHVRGGGLMGENWYQNGKLERKKNTFFDFIDVAKALQTAGFARPERTVISGASAGGLLIGAVLNMSPETFGLAVAEVPFVDVLNTMLDPSLPLTTEEYEEWGNPEDPHFFKVIHRYAPYENIRPQAYPHLLATAGLNDPRVGYWEAAKWVARLRQNQTADGLILLKTNLEAGHIGASGRYAALREIAYTQAFILNFLPPLKSVGQSRR